MTDRIRRVYFYHHTHTDIGYTHAQEEVVEQQAANITRALDFCAQTAHRPVESRFAWTVETGWTLARFWERADEEDRARFIHYAREGRVQITAGYFHLTQLAPPELLIRSLTSTYQIAAACGVAIDTALSCDINGVNLFYLHLFAQLGVRYLTTAINTGRGGSPLPEERPGGFWWEGPTGEHLLVWNNEMYQFGNDHLGFPDAPSYGALQRYCAQLEERGYPYDTVIIPVQGYHIDNAMPNVGLCDTIDEFNRAAGYTRCRLATLGEALRDVEARYGDQLPVYRGAWPDWWDDGIGSSAFETGMVRFAHEDLLTAEKAAALATALGAPDPFPRGELHRLAENLLHYDEHTWGWWRSVEDPYSVESRVLGQRKTLYAGEAAMEGLRYRERAVRALAAQVAPAEPEAERVIIFNPLAWERRELVRHCAVWRNPAGTTPGAVRVLDAEGRDLPVRCEIDHYSGCYIWWTDLWVEFEVEVPPLGYAIYTIVRTDQPVPPAEEIEGRVIENSYYRVEMDQRGAVISLLDKVLHRELVAPGPHCLNQLLYETISSAGGRADTLAPVYPPFDFMPGRAEVTLSTPVAERIFVRRDPFGATLVSTSSMAPFRSIIQEVRLNDAHKRVDFSTRLIKDEVDGTEAAYIAFPFALTPAQVQCDISGGVFTPGAEQIRGTASDWYNLAHGVQLRDEDLTLTWLCAEAPLVEFGEMKTGKTPSAPIVDNGLLFSYVLNNHWFTNFLARQSGEITARYRLLSERTPSSAPAGMAGQLSAQPVGTPAQGQAASPSQRTSSTVSMGQSGHWSAHTSSSAERDRSDRPSERASTTADLGRAGRELLTPLLPVRLGARSSRGPGLEVAAGVTGATSGTFARVLDGAAALDAVKQAHDGGGWVLRLHETAGRHSAVRLWLRWPQPVLAVPCDMLERPLPGTASIYLEGAQVLAVDLAPSGTASWRLQPTSV